MNFRLVAMTLIFVPHLAFGVTPSECAAYIEGGLAQERQLPRWSFPTVRADVMEQATRDARNPLVTIGDFDGDKQQDVAFLIRTTDDKLKVAVCLSSSADDLPQYIAGGCDGIETKHKGASYRTRIAKIDRKLPRDAVASYCVEKGETTYLLDKGVFRPLLDNDND